MTTTLTQGASVFANCIQIKIGNNPHKNSIFDISKNNLGLSREDICMIFRSFRYLLGLFKVAEIKSPVEFDVKIVADSIFRYCCCYRSNPFKITNKELSRLILLVNFIYDRSLYRLNIKPFWTSEYVKRKYFLNMKNQSVKDCTGICEHQELLKAMDFIKNHIAPKSSLPDCDFCFYFDNQNISKLPFPFFYNDTCKTPSNKMIHNEIKCKIVFSGHCSLKTFLIMLLCVYHNESNPSFLMRLKEWRLGDEWFKNSSWVSMNNWPDELRSCVGNLYDVSFSYGLYPFDFFSVTDFYKILERSCGKDNCFIELCDNPNCFKKLNQDDLDKINQKDKEENDLYLCNKMYSVSDEIAKIEPFEFFLNNKTFDSDIAFDYSSFPDKLIDSQNMGVVKRNIPDPMDLDLVKSRLGRFELVVGVGEELFDKDIKLKKIIGKIKGLIDVFDPSIKTVFDPNNYADCYVVFGFNPSNFKQPKNKNINKKLFPKDNYLDDGKAILKAYKTATMSLFQQISDAQKDNRDVFDRINYVRSYQNTDRSRSVGLYIWDQVHYMQKPVNDVINDFIESEFYDNVYYLSEEKITARNLSFSASGRRSSQDNYNEAYRNYQYAHCCIEAGEVLTGAECEKIITPKKDV